MARYAWTWNVKPEYVEEYVKMHLNPWDEIMKAHSEAGFKNYSIFQNGTQFFYVFECDGDPAEAFAKMASDPDCIRWNNITTKMLDVPLAGGGSSSILLDGTALQNTVDVSAGVSYMPEVFYLK